MIPDWSKALRKKNESTDLYLAMLSAASLQAGFAGVVVVFGLSAQPKAFKNLRIAAGNALVDNWVIAGF